MKIKKTPKDIFEEYSKGKAYNESIDLYENVEKNQNFFIGDQWIGVNAPNMVKPVFNIIKRVITYYVAMIVSDDIGVFIEPFDQTKEKKALANVLASQVEKILERTKTNAKCRTNIKNCAIDGDTCMYISFDPSVETNQLVKGDICTDIIDNTNIIFGNPYTNDVQKQPYILVVQRLYAAQVRDMAKDLGISKDDIEKIKPDTEGHSYGQNIGGDDELVTVITKFWKEKKKVPAAIDPRTGLPAVDPITQKPLETERTTVHSCKVVQEVTLMKDTDLDYTVYPIAYMSWEKRKNSYHGQAPITGLIPNQIFVNKIYAMCMVYMTNMGFPKVFYDNAKIQKLTNDVTKAMAMPNMDMAGKMLDAVKAPDFSNQIIQLIDSTISYTKDFMGASDAALGEISNPNNTSAIVAVQQASSVPLEIQKLDFYQFYEDTVRAIVDIMACSYGRRTVQISESQAAELGLIDHIAYIDPLTKLEVQPGIDPATGVDITLGCQQKVIYKTTMDIDFSQMRNMNFDLKVEIGQSSYWSERTQVQTMDNLFDRGVITDPVTYLEGIPDKYIKNKREILQKLKETQMAVNNPPVAPSVPAIPATTERMADDMDNRGTGAAQEAYAESKKFYGKESPDEMS